jgi:hypothetical protein
MRLTTRVAATVSFAAIAACMGTSHSAPNCKKGIPCGNSCIAANKTCRITASSSATVPQHAPVAQAFSSPERTKGPAAAAALPAAKTSAALPVDDLGTVWIGSIADSIYFRGTCSAAKDLAADNRRVFSSEQEARSLGFRRSSIIDC